MVVDWVAKTYRLVGWAIGCASKGLYERVWALGANGMAVKVF